MNDSEKEIEEIKRFAGEFLVFALEARRKYIINRLETEKEIRKLFVSTVNTIAKEIRSSAKDGTFFAKFGTTRNILTTVFQALCDSLINIFDHRIILSVDAGMHQSKKITLYYLNKARMDVEPAIKAYFRVSEQAVNDVKKRSARGLNISDRIWEKSNLARDRIGDIIQAGVRSGSNPVEIAKALEQYVRDGANTLAINYPNMMERLDGNIPQDLSYEALRLARTELAEAYGAGVKESVKASPSAKGVRWALSLSHPAYDVCDEHATHNEGLGEGVYSVDSLPRFPAHPNCLCRLEPVHENTDDFLDKLIKWNKQPKSQPELENWHQTVYKTGAL
ncbi:hypothetical protein [Rummeliibacillus sp. POC4]|uniref:hypothetical protein n=1 Tax=Rummeliibacillus sp. POC4 TaxID=2305899 RepID=UPI000E66975A|nr:hypothetical protein [Rummeliibacillus sp. POC4]RIJ63614.1 hypothetical protein D1606_14130 [Rummeliibacillus sp. POC4]